LVKDAWQLRFADNFSPHVADRAQDLDLLDGLIATIATVTASNPVYFAESMPPILARLRTFRDSIASPTTGDEFRATADDVYAQVTDLLSGGVAERNIDAKCGEIRKWVDSNVIQ
jgi:hypothetical protein